MPNYRLGEYTDICKKGAAASAKVQKDKSRARWEANRPKCLYCGKQWEWRDDQQGCHQLQRKYCDPSCKAKHVWQKSKQNFIKEHGENFTRSIHLRKKCMVAREGISTDARRKFHSAFPGVPCEICGYNKLPVEIAHIKPVKDFDNDDLVGLINALDNLVGLCANCHREFDASLVSIELVKSKVAARVKSSNGH